MAEEADENQPTFRQLLEEELRLDPRQWVEANGEWREKHPPAPSSDERRAVYEVDCLVSWCAYQGT